MTIRLAKFLRQAVPALVLIGTTVLASNVCAEEGYYKWTDTSGRTHLGDRPPPAGTDYKFVSTDTGISRSVAAEAAPGGSAAPAMPKPQASTETVAQQQITIEKNPEYCQQAQANIDTLDSVARIRIRDDDGEMRFLSEEEKATQRRKAEDMIAVHCN
ncbi:DUF4124 domain-containing protein [Candidatus Litorirhabdus singularis]|uniref:DUF4124 domain-containing protein n=1 Tax=Candidatus Litorirhabdus singularis TaxID=2518993 RepID=UPI00242F21BD|nr:DUF4124 domain-containing protein [Candidatus Litorirhabdus singularis]